MQNRSRIWTFFLSLACALGATTNISAQHVVALASDGEGWVVANGPRYIARDIPVKMFEQLQDYALANRSISAVAFSPGGGWTAIAGRAHATRGVGGDYYETLKRVIDKGQSVRAVAFNPKDWKTKRGFVIIHNQGFEAKNIPDALRAKLQEYKSNNTPIDAVAFTPTGGWTILFDRGSFTRGVGDTGNSGHVSYFDQIQKLVRRGANRGEAVAFVPKNYGKSKGYIIVTDGGFDAQDAPPALTEKLKTVFGIDGSVRNTGSNAKTRPTAELLNKERLTVPNLRTKKPGTNLPATAKPAAVKPATTASTSSTYKRVTTNGAEIDLQTFEIHESFERGGDEPYLIIYKFRGRLHERPRIHFKGLNMFKGDEGDAMYTNIAGGKNWAKSGTKHDIFANAGRVSFENLKPFEVYGVVVISAERDGTDIDGLYAAYELLQGRLISRFDRAIPFNGSAENYSDYSRSNTNSLVSRSLSGLQAQFGAGLEDEVSRTISNWVGSKGDRLVGAQAAFFINAPADLEAQPQFNESIVTAAVVPPGIFSMTFEEGTSSQLFRGDVVQAGRTGYRYVVRGLHRLY